MSGCFDDPDNVDPREADRARERIALLRTLAVAGGLFAVVVVSVFLLTHQAQDAKVSGRDVAVALEGPGGPESCVSAEAGPYAAAEPAARRPHRSLWICRYLVNWPHQPYREQCVPYDLVSRTGRQVGVMTAVGAHSGKC